jgi:hypothetical protein
MWDEALTPEVLLAACFVSFALIVWALGRAAAAGSEDEDDEDCYGELCAHCERACRRRVGLSRPCHEASASPPGSRTTAIAIAGARGADLSSHGQSGSEGKQRLEAASGVLKSNLRHEAAADVRKTPTGWQLEPALPTAAPGRRWVQIAEPPLQPCRPWTQGADVCGARGASFWLSAPDLLQHQFVAKASPGVPRARKAESSRTLAPGPPFELKGPRHRTNASGPARNYAMPPRWPAMESKRKSKMTLSSGTLFYTNVVKQEWKRRASEGAMDVNGDETD